MISKIKTRRESVKSLVMIGITQREIAKQMGISERTIRRDVRTIKDEFEGEVKEKGITDILVNFLLMKEGVFRESWKLYHRTSDDNVKSRQLRIVNDIIDGRIKILQSLGVVREVMPTQLEPMTIRIITDWDKNGDENKVQPPADTEEVPRKPSQV